MFVITILLILLFGIAFGYLSGTLEILYDVHIFLSDISGEFVQFILILLVFIIGLDMGLAESRLDKIKKSWKFGFLIALGTVSGSLMAGLLLSFLTSLPSIITLSVAAGMGWYSLTGPFLAKNFGAFAGALGFTANFIREVLTFIFYPKMGDKIKAISIGGATTMDSSLPIITRFSNPETGLIAFIHGFFISIMVPVLLFLLSGF
jgi:uncharacterized membrane protein YbjE (DUF340 family)